MNNQQPINFVRNHFVFPRDERIFASGEKEFNTLPRKEKALVHPRNALNYAKEVYIPLSQLYAHLAGKQFCNTLSNSDLKGFYDIETDDEEKFLLGYVNEKKFTDPEEMLQELLKYDVVIGFNIFAFDNEILARYCPDYFYEVGNADFIAHSLKGVVNLDILSILRIIIGKESYSAHSFAKEINFEEELLSYDEDKDKKCEQDIRLNKALFEKYNLMKVFNTISTLANTDVTFWQIIQKARLRKFILINEYLRNNFMPLKPSPAKIKMSAEPVKYSKRGIYENMIYYDISSAYPTTAVNLGNLGVYDDNIFSKLQRKLLILSEDPELKPFMKSIANPLCGAMYSENEYFRNEEIFNRIVGTVAEKVKDILEGRMDVVYCNTDCFVVPRKSPEVEIEGYKIKKNFEFDKFIVYNVNRWLGKIKDKIEIRGFQKLNYKAPEILKIAREEIHEKLGKAKNEKFEEFLEDYESLVKDTLKKIKKFPIGDFSFTIRKNEETCRDVSLVGIWKKLPMGFSQIYFDKNGEMTLDEKKIGRDYYKELVKGVAQEYSLEE